MKIASLRADLNYRDEGAAVEVIMETPVSKEIRILFKSGQNMKSHKAPFPIIVAVHQGTIEFGVNNQMLTLNSGDLVYLDANVPHSLMAREDSMVRLTLWKTDTVERVRKVASPAGDK